MQDSAPPHPGERRLALLLEYDGTAYCGSQYQENGPSIQQALESAINDLTGETARAAFAGRTDTGVHALGQVAAFSTRSRLGPPEFVPALNHFLPADVAVRRVVRSGPGLRPAPRRQGTRVPLPHRQPRGAVAARAKPFVARAAAARSCADGARRSLAGGRPRLRRVRAAVRWAHATDAPPLRTSRLRRSPHAGDGGRGLPAAPGAPDHRARWSRWRWDG